MTGLPDIALDQQLALKVSAQRLATEFDGVFGSETIERFLATPADRMLFCGMAIGYEDQEEPANRLRTERAPEEEWLSLRT